MNTYFHWGKDYDNMRQSEKRRDAILIDMQEHGPLSGRTVMDLGANVGFFSSGLARMGASVVAVEPPNEKDLDFPGVTPHRVWVNGPEDLPPGPFHYSLVLSVLHHIPRWKEVLLGVLERTSISAYIEVPHPKEHHRKWHGSQEQSEFLAGLDNTVIGFSPESKGMYKRCLFRVDV